MDYNPKNIAHRLQLIKQLAIEGDFEAFCDAVQPPNHALFLEAGHFTLDYRYHKGNFFTQKVPPKSQKGKPLPVCPADADVLKTLNDIYLDFFGGRRNIGILTRGADAKSCWHTIIGINVYANEGSQTRALYLMLRDRYITKPLNQ